MSDAATPTTSSPSPTGPAIGQSTGDIIPPMCSVFRRFLKRTGLKFTPERAQILDAVSRKQHVFEAEQLLYEMRDAGLSVSKATIYRTLKHLLDAGIITEVLIDAKQAHYRLSYGQAPRGHLVCVETGKVIEIPSPWLTALRDKICHNNGFEPVSTRLVIYGISPEAQEQERARQGNP